MVLWILIVVLFGGLIDGIVRWILIDRWYC